MTVCLMLASKFHLDQDEQVHFSSFADFLKVPSSELLAMELRFCELIDFQLNVEPRAFYEYQRELKVSL